MTPVACEGYFNLNNKCKYFQFPFAFEKNSINSDFFPIYHSNVQSKQTKIKNQSRRL